MDGTERRLAYLGDPRRAVSVPSFKKITLHDLARWMVSSVVRQ